MQRPVGRERKNQEYNNCRQPEKRDAARRQGCRSLKKAGAQAIWRRSSIYAGVQQSGKTPRGE
jgi:hypothetical protein